MSLLQRVCKTLGVLGLAFALPILAFAQPSYVTNGVEYAPAGVLAGDQVYPSLALNASGGFLVWHDNITDGSGYGISAVQLDSTLSPTFGNFRVNVQGSNDQENAQVAMLHGGGAAFVWQGGKQSFQHVYARFRSSSNVWVTGDVMVNAATNFYQANPVVATLANGNVLITWASYGQDNADKLQGVYARIFTPTGSNITGEIPINLTTAYNQRTPAIAALSSGGFVATWVSEGQRSTQAVASTNGNALGGYNSIDIYARLFDSSGNSTSGEILVNTTTNACANPTVAGASDGTFIISWAQRDKTNPNNDWDVFARPFSNTGTGGAVQGVNTQLYGDQFSPKISSVGTDYLVVWTSLAQDGSWEGVYGQFLHGDASHSGGEFRVNTTVLNAQKFQGVASDGTGRFLVAWSSYTGGVNSMDIYAQRFSANLQPLPPPGAPIVSAVDPFTLSVTWPPLAGLSVDHWNLYADSSSTPSPVTNLYWVNPTNYLAGQTHTFQLSYALSDGRISPLSPVASGKTWAPDGFPGDGIPDDWETLYYGSNKANWPKNGFNTVLTGNGMTVTLLQVFEWGANPNDPSTWLRANMTHTSQGWFLSWNTQPGYIYQVQTTTNFSTWSNFGAPRFAAGTTDSVFLGVTYKGFYRITRLIY